MERSQQACIVAGLRCGDAAAWHALYDEYAEAIWVHVARRVGPFPADVADIVQETFLAAARSAASYDERRGCLWNWLCGIASNQAALHFRKEAQRQRCADAFQRQMSTNVGELLETPASHSLRQEVALVVRDVLHRLPGNYGTLLTARYLDDESVDEMATRLQTTSTAIRSKLARARRAFRQAYQRLQPGQNVP